MVRWGQNESGGAGHWTPVCQKLGNSGDDINVLFSQEMQKLYPCYTVASIPSLGNTLEQKCPLTNFTPPAPTHPTMSV